MHPFHLQNGSYRDNKISLSIDVVTCNSSVELAASSLLSVVLIQDVQVVGRGKKLTVI